MLDHTYRDQSYQFFIEEASELLECIETELLSLRCERSLAKVHSIMRATHSIKGGAASVGLDTIQFLAHRLEDFFKVLYDDSLMIDVELEGLLLQGFDCLKNPLKLQIEVGSHNTQEAIASAEPIFEQLTVRLGDLMTDSCDYLPSSTDLGIDLTQSIFEVDVQQSLNHLETVLAAQEHYDICSELLSTIEIFSGFAQLLNLPGLSAITSQIRQALDLHPEKALEITQIAILNLRSSQSLVLSGDRTSGGKPSDELLRFTQSHKQVSEQEIIFGENTEDNFQDQAYRFFIEEARELLQIIETELLTLRSEKTKSKVHEIMRASHSIKGGAASVGLEAIRSIAHRLEDFFKALYSNEIDINTEVEGLLLDGFDCLKNPLIEQIETDCHNEELALAKAKPIFERLEFVLKDALHIAEYNIPDADNSVTDMASSIFETDVPKALERLVKVLASPQDYEVTGELRATAEVLQGFAQLLNLPGLGEIASETIRALELQPQKAVAITQVALANFQASREQVLAGDRIRGGNPSPELLALTKVDDIQEQAYQFFLEEAVELLLLIEEGLSTLQEEKSKPRVHEITRAVHSIKGGAASAGLETIRVLAYRLEKIFRALYDDSAVLTEELMSLLQQGFNCLKSPLIQQIEGGSFDEIQALEMAEPIFEQLEIILADILNKEEEYIPSSTDLGIDIVSSIFEIDVQQELDKLADILTDYKTTEIATQLTATLEVLAGFAELFNLPGWGAICSTTLTAVQGHRGQEKEITAIALRNFQLARELVLSGDRSTGGEPSQELLALVNDSSELGVISIEDVFVNSDEEKLSTPTLDEVFGSEAESSLLPVVEKIDLQTSTLDEIFGLVETQSNLLPVVEEIDLSTSALDEVFGLVEAQSNLLPIVEEIDLQTPALDEVFGSVEAQSNLLPAAEEIDLPTSALDEVFGSVEAQSNLLPIVEEIDLLTPAIDEIFGSAEAIKISDFSNSSLENSFDLTDKNTKPLNEKLEDLISLVENNFDKFNTAIPISPNNAINESSSQSSDERAFLLNKNKNAVASSSESSKPEASSLSVRVDFNRLERMNNLVGELAINRNSLSLQNSQLQNSVKELLNRFGRFHSMADKLRELSDLMLINASAGVGFEHKLSSSTDILSLPTRTKLTGDESTLTDKSDFDTLEMDRYGSLYSVLQSILEEMLQLEESVDDIVLFARGSNQTLEQQRQMLTTLRDELMWARMLPLGEVLNRFPRVLRDLSTTYRKPVRLKLVGTGVLVDRAALEKLYDPLLHLLRNAFDHGIEPPSNREEKGKFAEGLIEIRAYHQGNQTVIEIKDDGNGLNLDKIRTTALNMSIVTPQQLAVMSNDNVADLIFEPGFSTANKVSELSGRGVGLDVVRSQLQSLKGTVVVSSLAGQGTTFTLRLPLTMTIAKLLVCLINSRTFDGGVSAIAVPSDSIEEIVIPEPEQIKKSGDQRFLYWQEQIIPIYPVCNLLDYRCRLPKTFSSKVLNAVPMPSDWGLPLLLIRRGQQIFALEVNRLITEQELVIKPFGACVAPPPYTYGCTILGDGTLIPVLNGIILLEQFLDPNSGNSSTNQEKAIAEHLTTSTVGINQTEVRNEFCTPTILVVDDSAALRRTLALTLQKSGYRVMQARDGREAIDQLQQTTNVQLVICDVEMPNMNGFEFLGQRRRYPELMKIPVAMLTSRSSDKHRQLATHLGASAYFTKPYIEQQFLMAVKKIINP